MFVNQQLTGIEKIRESVKIIDRVAVQIVVNADESALAPNTMKFQADQMNTIVANLVKLIKGASSNGYRKHQAPLHSVKTIPVKSFISANSSHAAQYPLPPGK